MEFVDPPDFTFRASPLAAPAQRRRTTPARSGTISVDRAPQETGRVVSINRIDRGWYAAMFSGGVRVHGSQQIATR